MKTTIIRKTGKLSSVETFEGEYLEQKIERIMTQNEPIKDGAPPIYTEKKDGVKPAYDIRTDRWEIAYGAMNKIDASESAKRDAKADMKIEKTGTEENG